MKYVIKVHLQKLMIVEANSTSEAFEKLRQSKDDLNPKRYIIGIDGVACDSIEEDEELQNEKVTDINLQDAEDGEGDKD